MLKVRTSVQSSEIFPTFGHFLKFGHFPKFGPLSKVRTSFKSSDIVIRTFQVKILIFARENTAAKIVNELLVLKLNELSNGDFIFCVACLQQLQTLC